MSQPDDSSLPEHGHEPVLPAETLAYLDVRPGGTVLDCTLGRGGHASLIAERLGADGAGGLLVGMDADPRNLEYARGRLAGAPCRVHLAHANFAEARRVLAEAGVEAGQVDGVLADLGVSTNQLITADYGLSFNADPTAPLDMRLDPGLRHSAADLLQRWSEKEIANVLYSLAQERYSRRIARKIVEMRGREPILTVGQLSDLVRSVVPREKRGRGKHARTPIDPATRTFMALRMAVNRELDVLQKLLGEAPQLLAPGGRLVVISFHSGEDRLVKQALRDAASLGILELLTKKPVTPGEAEMQRNPRSRSAKLRAAMKL